MPAASASVFFNWLASVSSEIGGTSYRRASSPDLYFVQPIAAARPTARGSGLRWFQCCVSRNTTSLCFAMKSFLPA